MTDEPTVPAQLRRPPPEDAGAATLSRYRFQAECALRWWLQTLTDDTISLVICESVEDFVVLWSDGHLELVSVKHREPGLGPWSTSELLKRGGLERLQASWSAANAHDPRTTSRFVTNAGVKSGLAAPERCESIAVALGVSPEETAAFLERLTVESELPSRKHISAVNQHDVLTPVLRTIGAEVVDVAALYEALVARVLRASADDGRGMAARILGLTELTEAIAAFRTEPLVVIGELVDLPVAPAGELNDLALAGVSVPLRRLSSGGSNPYVERSDVEFELDHAHGWPRGCARRRAERRQVADSGRILPQSASGPPPREALLGRGARADPPATG